jgi:hypothetical protein
MICRRFPVALAMIAVTLPLAGTGYAQDASPAAGTPAAEPVACVAEPRDAESLLALWFDAEGNPAATPAASEPVTDIEALPVGTEVDLETAAALTELTREWVFCVQFVGQHARAFSLMTDEFAAQFGPSGEDPAQDAPDEVRAILEAQVSATPVTADRVPALAGPRKPRMLDDGRAAAIWSLGGDKLFLVYEQVDGRWLLDDAIDIIDTEATPTP